jgi:rhodanese-related sulfurtransferase
MSKETSDTLGHQKKANYALQPMSKEKFIDAVTDGLQPPPQYFSMNASLNKAGAGSLDKVYQGGLRKLSPPEFELALQSTEALVLDTREPDVFAGGFVPGSINISLDGQFAPWVGTLITDSSHPVLIVCEEGREEESVLRLARVGYDNTIGYLKGGIQSWKQMGKEVDTIVSVSANEFSDLYGNELLHVLDVRRPAEYEAGHVKGAENKPLDFINDWTPELTRDESYYIHCAAGYRSMVAVSILKARGFSKLVNVAGGYSAIATTNIPVTVILGGKV